MVFCLALSIIMPLLSNPATSYAANSIQYKIDYCGVGAVGLLKTDDLEKLLNQYSKEGWDPISINIVAIGLGGKALVVFKK